ncbi:MAG: BMC domain-containing protein [Lactovum sp.]
MAECLGMIEVRGYLAAVAAADAALKAANVCLASSEKIKGGITTILLNGDVGAVTAAVEAAALVAREIGLYRSHHIIPRPDIQTDECFIKKQEDSIKAEKLEIQVDEKETVKETVNEDEKEKSESLDFESMKVVDLRKLALRENNFSLTKKEIKYSNKAQLIEAFEKIKIKGGKNE